MTRLDVAGALPWRSGDRSLTRKLQDPPGLRELEAIYRRYHRLVRWALRARAIDDDELEDLVHDVFLAIHRRLPDRDPDIGLPAWIVGVARGVAFSHRRGHARRLAVIEAMPEPETAVLPDEEAARRQAWSRLAAFLDELDGDQREAFVLIDLVGMRAAEIAELTGTAANTISSRLRLARRKFESHFATEAGAFLRRAGEGERPRAVVQRRTWTAIAAGLPAGKVVGLFGVGAAAKWIAAGVLAAGVVVAVRRPAPVVLPTRSIAIDSVPEAPTVVAAAQVPAAKAEPTPIAPQPAPAAPLATRPGTPPAYIKDRPPTPPEDPPEDPLADAVRLLREAEHQLARGEAASALRSVDEYRDRFEDTALHRDLLRIERRAACAAADPTRAEKAKAALVTLHVAERDAPACPTK